MATQFIAKHWLNKNQYIAEMRSSALGAVLAIVTIDDDGKIVRVAIFKRGQA